MKRPCAMIFPGATGPGAPGSKISAIPISCASTRSRAFGPAHRTAGSFVEHKDVMGLTVQANLGNLFGRSENFTRTVYANRRDGPVAFVEDRSREFGLIYRLTVSGSF